MSLLEQLVLQRKLLDPDDRSPLAVRDGRIVTRAGRDLGPAAGPLDFLHASGALDPSGIPAAEVEKIRTHLQLAPTDEVRTEIARAIAATRRNLDEKHLLAESRMLAERFRLPEFELEPAATPARPENAQRKTTAGRLRHVSNSVGPRLTAARQVFRSVRVRNDGESVLPAGSRATVLTEWTSSSGANLKRHAIANEIPVDMEPGREITLMLRLDAPVEPGPYTLHARLVVSGEREAPAFLSLPVDVVLCDLPVFAYEYSPHLLDYRADHAKAAEEVLDYLAKHHGPGATVLEIGGGVHPAGSAFVQAGHRLVSSDISHSQSILGALYFRHAMPQAQDALGFVTCDGTRLPFADESFDGVVLLAAFHHFADPPGLLRELRRVIAGGGFVFIGCDCCAPNPREPDYLSDLARGINEQMFTLPEYTMFFEQAGLTPARARVDFHSIKVFVVKDGRAQPGAHEERSRLFVRRQFVDVLGREADPQGLEYWTRMLANGSIGEPQLVQGLLDSAECRDRLVPLAALALARRTGLPAFDVWEDCARRSREGEPLERIAEAIAVDEPGASLLARSRAGQQADDARIRVLLAHATLLRRMPDAEALASWSARLTAGLAPQALAEHLLGSDEYRRR